MGRDGCRRETRLQANHDQHNNALSPSSPAAPLSTHPQRRPPLVFPAPLTWSRQSSPLSALLRPLHLTPRRLFSSSLLLLLFPFRRPHAVRYQLEPHSPIAFTGGSDANFCLFIAFPPQRKSGQRRRGTRLKGEDIDTPSFLVLLHCFSFCVVDSKNGRF